MKKLNVTERTRHTFVAAALAMSLTAWCGLSTAFGEEGSSAPLPAPVEAGGTSLSTSRQFVIHGRTLALRSAFSVFAERVKADYLSLLYASGTKAEGIASPIVLQVLDDAPTLGSKAVMSRILQLEQGGFRLEVIVRMGDGIDSEVRRELRRELLRMLLAESILRGHKTINAAGRSELLPKWLMTGVSETLGHKSSGRPSELYEKVFRTGRILTVEEILSTDPERLDTVSRAIFELSCAGLLQTLLEEPIGSPGRLRAFIFNLATYTGSQRDLLLRHFPALRASGNSLEKRWALQMATMSQPGGLDKLTPEETELAIADALLIQFEWSENPSATGQNAVTNKTGIASVSSRVIGLFRPKGRNRTSDGPPQPQTSPLSPTQAGENSQTAMITCGVEELERYFHHPEKDGILTQVQKKLADISHQAHPLYRLVIHDYQETIGRLAEGNREGADALFASLAGRRTAIQRQAAAITDRLNWLESRNETPSGKFEAFHRAVDAIENDRRPGRRDPISRYLDALEQEFK